MTLNFTTWYLCCNWNRSYSRHKKHSKKTVQVQRMMCGLYFTNWGGVPLRPDFWESKCRHSWRAHYCVEVAATYQGLALSMWTAERLSCLMRALQQLQENSTIQRLLKTMFFHLVHEASFSGDMELMLSGCMLQSTWFLPNVHLDSQLLNVWLVQDSAHIYFNAHSAYNFVCIFKLSGRKGFIMRFSQKAWTWRKKDCTQFPYSPPIVCSLLLQ